MCSSNPPWQKQSPSSLLYLLPPFPRWCSPPQWTALPILSLAARKRGIILDFCSPLCPPFSSSTKSAGLDQNIPKICLPLLSCPLSPAGAAAVLTHIDNPNSLLSSRPSCNPSSHSHRRTLVNVERGSLAINFYSNKRKFFYLVLWGRCQSLLTHLLLSWPLTMWEPDLSMYWTHLIFPLHSFTICCSSTHHMTRCFSSFKRQLTC